MVSIAAISPSVAATTGDATSKTASLTCLASPPGRIGAENAVAYDGSMARTLSGARTLNRKLLDWVDEVAALGQPDRVEWCDGSADEHERLCRLLVERRTFTRLSDAKRPNSFWAHSDPADVARVEKRTFVCSIDPEDAGPTNNWVDPGEMRAKLTDLFRGAMAGRTMYVVPFSMGPMGSPIARLGVEITDSPYVVVNMRIMTRMGTAVLEAMGADGDFGRCVHSVGCPSPPASTTWRGPATLSRSTSSLPRDARDLVVRVRLRRQCPVGEEVLRFADRVGDRSRRGLARRAHADREADLPGGEVRYVAGAFPSACGKTNLAMLVPTMPGWKVETIGDDICWMKIGPDGMLRAINPEAGFFGVAPGTTCSPTRMRSSL